MTISTLLYGKYIIKFILLNRKYVHNVFTILLPNFQFIQRKSPLLQYGLRLFAKGEVKNLSKVDSTSLVEWPDRSCLLLYVSARIH